MLKRENVYNVLFSDAELEQLKTLANDLGMSGAALIRLWIRTSWADRVKDENARAWENGVAASDLDAPDA